MTKKLLAIFIFSAQFYNAVAQSTWSNTIVGLNPGLVNPFRSGEIVNGRWSVSGIGHSQNVSGSTGNDLYNTNLWSTSNSLEETRYIYFTLTPNAGYKINLESFTYSAQSAPNGPTLFSFRSSIDGYASDIGQPNATGTTIRLSSFQNLDIPVTFRLYAYGATDAFSSFGISRFEFRGETPLPVKFGNLYAFFDENLLNIKWETESEGNNSCFTIEVSKNGREFFPVRKVASKARNGNLNQRLHYHEHLEIENLYPSILVTPFIILLLSASVFRRRSVSVILAVFILVLVLPYCSKTNSKEITNETNIYVRIAQTDIDGNISFSKIVKAMK